MADHAWCRDPAEAAAVRAAEDGRDGALPTLGEAIGEVFPLEADFPATEKAAREETSQSGLRTERVTLEVTHGESFGVSHWSWVTILRIKSGESVRVVEEAVVSVDARAYADSMACDEERDFANRILAERDAAIRERDAHKEEYYKLRAERITQALTADRFASVVAERDAAIRERDELKARAAELEAASGGGEGEPVAWRVEYRGFIEIYSVEQFATERASEVRGTVVPLYRSPPQPRGWLTGEEREAVESARLHLSNVDGLDEESEQDARWASERVASLLARSTPPEVVLPKLHTRCEVNEANHKSPCLWFRRPDVIAALAAAGVTVAE